MTRHTTGVMIDDSGAAALNETEFFADVIGELAHTLEDVVGLSDAEGFISTVGGRMGARISDIYDTGSPVSEAYIAQILVDLKNRIGGNFSVASISNDQIVLSNTRCPFGDRVHGKKSLCLMTTNVFGRIVSDRNGYAHVDVPDSIAENRKHCTVIVTLKPEKASMNSGYEFFSE